VPGEPGTQGVRQHVPEDVHDAGHRVRGPLVRRRLFLPGRHGAPQRPVHHEGGVPVHTERQDLQHERVGEAGL